MSALRATVSLAGFELRGAARSRWVTVGAAVFAVAGIAAVLAGLRSLRELGLAGGGAATDGLLHVALLLPPLIGILLGAGTIARDRECGVLAAVAAQPLRRSQLPLAAFLGSAAAAWAIVGIGTGAAALLLAGVATVQDLVGLLAVVGVSLAAVTASVAIGVAISSLSRTHHQATVVAASVWLLLALGMDLLLAGVAPGLRLGPAGLLAFVLANPLEAARVLALLVLEDRAGLGPFGIYLVDGFGHGGAAALLAGSLGFWIAAPIRLAQVVVARRDV